MPVFAESDALFLCGHYGGVLLEDSDHGGDVGGVQDFLGCLASLICSYYMVKFR